MLSPVDGLTLLNEQLPRTHVNPSATTVKNMGGGGGIYTKLRLNLPVSMYALEV